MPILNLPLSPDGAILDVLIGVSEPRRQALAVAGQQIPPPIPIRALVDIGATTTSIVASILQPLGITPTGSIPVSTSLTGSSPVPCNQFDISLILMHPILSRIFGVVPVIECQPLSPSFQALLGRDLLAHCLLVYNGQGGTFSLAF